MPINFNRYLKENKLNILKVSRMTGIANSTLYAWRDGKVPLTTAKLNLIADKLNVSVDFLLDKTVDPTPTKNLIEEYNKAMQTILMRPNTPYAELQQKYNSLTEENQRALLEYADFLLYKQNKNRP